MHISLVIFFIIGFCCFTNVYTRNDHETNQEFSVKVAITNQDHQTMQRFPSSTIQHEIRIPDLKPGQNIQHHEIKIPIRVVNHPQDSTKVQHNIRLQLLQQQESRLPAVLKKVIVDRQVSKLSRQYKLPFRNIESAFQALKVLNTATTAIKKRVEGSICVNKFSPRSTILVQSLKTEIKNIERLTRGHCGKPIVPDVCECKEVFLGKISFAPIKCHCLKPYISHRHRRSTGN